MSNVIGHWNLELDGLITTNNYTENFFGYGNETFFNEDSNFDIDRVLLQRRETQLVLDKAGDYGSRFTTGVGYQNIEVERLENDQFLNAIFNYSYQSLDDERFTTHGMVARIDTRYTDDLKSSTSFFNLDPSITFWNAIDNKRKFVFKTQLAGQFRLGDDPLFYQAARLGANNGLRSYRMQRFTGDRTVNGSVDLLYDLNPAKTRLLPLHIAAYAGFDAGRVWWNDLNSQEFHTSYGGGFQFSMSGLFKANASYFYGDEGGRLQLGLSFSK